MGQYKFGRDNMNTVQSSPYFIDCGNRRNGTAVNYFIRIIYMSDAETVIE